MIFFRKKEIKLAHGENPYQGKAKAVFRVKGDPLSLGAMKQVAGSVPCYTNLVDTDALVHTLCLAAEAFAAQYGKVPNLTLVGKHGNACGLSYDWDDPQAALKRALWGNPRAVWGGECVVNFSVDQASAQLLFQDVHRQQEYGSPYWMFDVVVAPSFSQEALSALGVRQSRKLFKHPGLQNPCIAKEGVLSRPVRGGFVSQEVPCYVFTCGESELVGVGVSDTVRDNLLLAWSVAYGSFHGGNEVALVKEGKLIGVAGGPSTIEAAHTAITRAQTNGHDVKGAVFAADAFFPFTDVPRLLGSAGVQAGVVPAGGKHHAQVRDFFATSNISVYYIPAQYRGFIRH